MPEQALSAEIRVSEDRSTVSIGLAGAGGGAVTLRLNIDDLTKLIAALGNARQSMAVGRPMPPLKGQQIPPVYKPQWCIQPEPLSEGSALSFYHPAFGSVAFVVPREHVEAMVRLLRGSSWHLPIYRKQTKSDDFQQRRRDAGSRLRRLLRCAAAALYGTRVAGCRLCRHREWH